MSIVRLFAGTLAGAWLSACGSMNVVGDGADARLMLQGRDPVAYFKAGKPVRGDAAIKADHDGVTYRFASDANRAAFLEDPAKYAPQYGGFCAHGMAYAVKLGGDPQWWRIADGRLFIYGDQEGHDFAGERLAFHIERGDHYWSSEARDAPIWRQYVKRVWLDKVPDYRSGTDLECEWLKKYPDRPHGMFKGRDLKCSK